MVSTMLLIRIFCGDNNKRTGGLSLSNINPGFGKPVQNERDAIVVRDVQAPFSAFQSGPDKRRDERKLLGAGAVNESGVIAWS